MSPIGLQIAEVKFFFIRCCSTNMHQVYPWVHQYVNNLKPEHQTKGVSFPDINPRELTANSVFTMAAGDFLEVMIFFLFLRCNILNGIL